MSDIKKGDKRGFGNDKFLNLVEHMLGKDMHADVLALANDRLKANPLDADAYVAAATALLGMGLDEPSRQMVRDATSKLAAFSSVFERLAQLYETYGLSLDARLCRRTYHLLNPSGGLHSDADDSGDGVAMGSRDTEETEDRVLAILSAWLQNIHRMKQHGHQDA